MNGAFIKVAVAANVLWLCFAGLMCTDSGIGMIPFLAFIYGGLGLLALWVLRFVFYRAWGRKQRTLPWQSWGIEPVFVGLVAAAVLSGGAFSLRFLLSRPFLSQFAAAISRGAPDSAKPIPLRVGLFVVREAEALPGGVVRLITTSCGFDHCGLAYSPSGAPPVIGEDTYVPLGSGWWQWQRSW